MEENELRLILPKASLSQKSSTTTRSDQNRRRQQPVAIACDTCRKRKTACGGQRPSCDLCQKRGIPCHYQRHPRVEKNALREEVERLQAANEALIQENGMLRQRQRDERTLAESNLYKSHGELVMHAMNNRSLSESLSIGPSTRALVPDIHSEIELLLQIQYPQAYPHLDAQDKTKLHSAYSYVRGLNSMNSSRRITRMSDEQHFQLSSKRKREDEQELWQSQESIDQGESSQPQQFPTDFVLNDILFLEDVNIRCWTDLPIPHEHVLGAMKLYFETDHPLSGVFDGKLFLRDFLSGSTEFCSSFLVISFFAYILQPYMIDEDPQSLFSKTFQTRAVALWQDKNIRPHDHINTVAGLVFLSLSLTLSRDGDLGGNFLEYAVEMATRLRLLNVELSASSEAVFLLEGDSKQATAHVAWGTYNLATIHNHLNVVKAVDIAPLIPLPVCHKNDIAYLSPGIHSLSIGTSQVFIGMCKLCPHLAGIRRDRSDGSSNQLLLALSRFNEILAIQTEESSDTISGPDSKAACLIFNIWYHVLIMDLFRPFVTESRQGGFTHWITKPSLPEAIFSASLKQLIQLSIEFSMTQLRVTSQSSWWHIGLLYIANAALRDPLNPDHRLLFLFCISCYQNITLSYPIFIGMVKALLGMAAERRMLTLHEAHTILATCEASLSRSSKSFGIYTVDLDRALTVPEQARVDTLTDQLDALNVFDAWTQDILP